MRRHIGFLLKQANLLHQMQLNQIFKEFDLTASQTFSLIYLFEAKRAQKEVNQKDIEREMDVSNPTVTAVDTSYRVITKKDLWRTFRYALAIESGNCTTRQEADGILQGMIPVLDKVYEDKSKRAEAYQRHCELFLTEGRMASICIGISCAMEESNAKVGDIDVDSINAIKVALMGPLAGDHWQALVILCYMGHCARSWRVWHARWLRQAVIPVRSDRFCSLRS